MSRGRLSSTWGLCLIPIAAFGHHGLGGRFDTSSIAELEGEVTRVFWRNPHVRITIGTTNEDGVAESWEVEAGPSSTLQRMGLSSDIVEVGDTIRIAGHPPTRDVTELFAVNLLGADGQEVLLTANSKPRWFDRTLGSADYWLASEGETSDPSLGIFRTWSTVGHPGSYPLFPENADPELVFERYPLTDSARAAVEAFDPAEDNPIENCVPKGMPIIMEQPYPMEIVDQGDTILMRLEEYDTVRTIHMNAEAVRVPQRVSPLGSSMGHWDGSTLVVTTGAIDWPFFNQTGIPQSEAVRIVERFTPTADGSRLNYQATIVEPVSFTVPVVLEKYWLWLPAAEVTPFNCTVDGE